LQLRQKRSSKNTELWENENSVFRTQEYSQKQSSCMKSLWNDKNSKFNSIERSLKISKALAKPYTIIPPNNKPFNIVGLSKFCEENNLSRKQMSRVASGLLESHRGYKCIKLY